MRSKYRTISLLFSVVQKSTVNLEGLLGFGMVLSLVPQTTTKKYALCNAYSAKLSAGGEPVKY